MTARHTAVGEIVALIPDPAELKSGLVIREPHAEVFRLVLNKGKHLAEHSAAGAITIQCLSGAVEMTALGKTQLMQAGTLVYLADHEPHAVTAVEESVLLISMWLNRI